MFKVGDRVRKIKGSSHFSREGTVVGLNEAWQQLIVKFDRGSISRNFLSNKFELIDKPEDYAFDV